MKAYLWAPDPHKQLHADEHPDSDQEDKMCVPSAFNDLSLHLFPEWKVTDDNLPFNTSAPQRAVC